MKSFDYVVADELAPALSEYAGGKVALKAGGIDLIDLMKERVISPDAVLSINGIKALRYIRQDAGAVHIGALSTLADLARSELIEKSFPVLHHAAAHAATPQIRERATVGGNLCQRRCWYFRNHEFPCLKKGGAICFAFDGENQYHAIFTNGPCHIVHPSNLAPALVALNVSLVVKAQGTPDETIPAEKFFVLPEQNLKAENVLKPGQVITDIILPKSPAQSATIELREKQSFDWPIAIASVARLDGAWRVCLGAVAPIPWLSVPAMKVLGGADITPELAAKAADASVADAMPLSGNSYKVQVVKVAVRRALLKAAGLSLRADTAEVAS